MKRIAFALLVITTLLAAGQVFAETKSVLLTEQTTQDQKKTCQIFAYSTSDAAVPAKGVTCIVNMTLFAKDGTSPVGGASISVGYPTINNSGSQTDTSGRYWFVSSFSAPSPSESVNIPVTITITRSENDKQVTYSGVYTRTQPFSQLNAYLVPQALTVTGSGVYVIISPNAPCWAKIGFNNEAVIDKPGSGTWTPAMGDNQSISGFGECRNDHFMCGNPSIDSGPNGPIMAEMQVSTSGTNSGKLVYLQSPNPNSVQSDPGLKPSKAIICESSAPSGRVEHHATSSDYQNRTPLCGATVYTSLSVGSGLLAKTGGKGPSLLVSTEANGTSTGSPAELPTGGEFQSYLETIVSGESASTGSFDISHKSSCSITEGKGIASASFDVSAQGNSSASVRDYEPDI